MSTTRHYPYTCAACGRQLDSTTVRRIVRYDSRGIRRADAALCRAAGRCGATTEQRAAVIAAADEAARGGGR